MPHIAITMFPGRNADTKTKLAQKVQACISAELDLDPQFISVSIQDVQKADWEKSMEQFPADSMYVKPGSR